ncbi:MAG: 30S ribosomal protein S6 [Trichodesmium sp. St16_bin2-tuft]|jgi:ribosomal protein S6|nr:30S ribosomal protein S6 [Trichodesmium sp. St18_bin1]MDE5088114.1 30S ribosomal protein S6 [Trichodesmium sp. St16_bin2-tuft]MDE5116150.1 30S ribosomal protein S6 [Trichodesmium sp. St2_bin2_1]MDE5124238.1 30S ribosomal protein S6 [Trichodesmium sp. St19_bin1]
MKQFIYETMYILRPDLTEEQVEQAITKYKDMLQEQGAYNLEIQHRGKRRLAYEINDQREGTYIQMNYQAPPTQISVLEKAMRLSEEVIRYLTVKQEVPKTTNTDAQNQSEPVGVDVE